MSPLRRLELTHGLGTVCPLCPSLVASAVHFVISGLERSAEARNPW